MIRGLSFWKQSSVVLLGLGFFFYAGAARAAIDKCQLEIEKRTTLFQTKVAQVLKNCADAIRREQVKNQNKPGSGWLVLAAHRCQKDLNRILDLPQILGGKSERDKFFAALQAAFSGSPVPKCSADDLRQLGFLPAGSLAPGTNAEDFAKVWLAAIAFERALQGQLSMQADFLAMLRDAILAPSKPPGTSVTTAATNCSQPSSCDPRTTPGCRPDLCRLGLQCHTASCSMDTGVPDVGFRIDRPSAPPLSSTPTSASLGFCALQGLGYPLGNLGEGILLAGDLSRSLPPLTVGSATVCGELLRVSGYCACAAPFTNLPRDVSLCQDRLLGNGESCSGTAIPGTGGADAAHTGTTIGPVRESWSDATSTGDCVALAVLRITVVSSGGEGPDGQPCTPDDSSTLSASKSLLVPLTTGAVSAQLEDAVATSGGCSGSGSCIEDANCASGQTCTNPAPGLSTLVGPSLAGSALAGSCANFSTGQLGGLQLVGSAPVPQFDSALGDTVISIKLACQ